MEKLFLKITANKTGNEEEIRQKVGQTAGFFGIIINTILAITKIAIGFFVHSLAISADGINNLFDTISGVATMLGFHFSSRPADEKHPYGHGRIEYLAAMIVSFFVLMVGIQFISFSLDRIREPKAIKFSTLPLIVMCLSLLPKIWLYRLNHYFGKKINSQVLVATAQDSLGDILTTLVVLLPLITSYFTDFPIDGYIGLLVSFLIIYNALTLIKESSNPLIGEAPPEELIQSLHEEITRNSLMSNLHEFTYENRGGGKALMTVHVEMPADLTLEETHHIINRVERRIKEKFQVQLIIHPEPKGPLSEKEKALLKRIREALKSFDEIVAYYDFHFSEKDQQVFLDIEVLPDSNINTQALEKEVLDKLNCLDDLRWNLRFLVDFTRKPLKD